MRDKAVEVIKAEISALEATIRGLDNRFDQAIGLLEIMQGRGGKIIFSGVGKNIFIAQKLAATFNSTGVAALFLDPLAAMHGDLGLCKEGDLAILMSNSGESDEIITLVPMLKRMGLTTLALTKDPVSRLGQICDKVLPYAVPSEACPLNLAPTASTTAALAMGDALAMCFLIKRGFKPEDFAKYHPSGTLGKTLLLRVSDVMRPRTQIAVVDTNATVMDALSAMTDRKTGIVAVTEEGGKLVGVFSDGDFRRLALKVGNPLKEVVSHHMVRTPKTIQAGLMAVEAVRKFEAYRINQLVVVDEYGFPIGMVDNQDLPRLKLI